MDNMMIMRHWLNQGWKFRECHKMDRLTQRAYRARVEAEVQVYKEKGFIDYFLMLSDMIRWAKDLGIFVGPGRGSAAASLPCYLLRITEIDPMPHPLMLHERFVSPDRDDLPDVDIDFESDRRDEVRQYAVAKYGAEMVGNIGTLTYYRGKNSVKMVGRVYEVPFAITQKVADMIVDSDGNDQIAKTRELFPVVEEIFQQYPQLAAAERLEGNVAGFGVHAAGLAIGNRPLSNFTTTYEKHNVGKAKKTVQVLSVDKYDAEPLGLLKVDALGLKTMTMIRIAAETVGMSNLNVYEIPMDDPLVLQGFVDGHVGGVFQFEGSTTRDICVELGPQEFMDLSHITSLSRPGPLHGGSTADFIASRHGEAERELYPQVVESVLEATEGEIVYQEQVIALAKSVGRFDSVGASKVRSIISKKKGQAAFAELYDEYLEGAASQGIGAEVAAAIWAKMVTSGAYSFNAAHAVSYSVLSVWCMWFRVHHPLAFFYARLMANVDAGKDPKTKVSPTETILKDMAASTDIKVLPLDPAYSQTDWSIEDGALRPGFRQVPTIGADKGDAIVAWRENLDRETSQMSMPETMLQWSDLEKVKGIGPGTWPKLQAFAEDPDPFEVGKIGRNTQAIVEWLPEEYGTPNKLSSDIPYSAGRWDGVLLGVVQEVQYRDLFESHLNRTGKVLNPQDVTDPHLRKSAVLYIEDVRGRFKVNIGRQKFPQMAEDIAAIKAKVTYALVSVGKSDRFPGKTLFCNTLVVIDPDEE